MDNLSLNQSVTSDSKSTGLKDKLYDLALRNNRFAFDIFNLINKGDLEKNLFISPFSISTVLSMVYQGAKNLTRDEMDKALGYEGMDIKDLNKSYKSILGYLRHVNENVELDIGNSIWVRESKSNTIIEDFISTNKEIFDSHVAALDFSKPGAADIINSWISQATQGKLKNMVESPVDQNTFMYLVNAVYFKGEWKEQFDIMSTFETCFTCGNGERKQVKMMRNKLAAGYTKSEGFQAVRLLYGNGSMSMYCILPDSNISINDFIEDMDFLKWGKIKESMKKTQDVTLHLPRFKLEYGIKDIKDSLISLGMNEAFSVEADFSGICKEGVLISKILHKAVIEVTEEGSEASASTVVEMRYSAPKIFTADRPFIFIIEDSEYGTILFMGKLYDI